MSSDTIYQNRRCSVKVTETVIAGKGFMLDTSNHWPNVLVTTGESVYCLGVFLADGVTGDTVPAMLFHDVVMGYGTVTEGAAITPGASGAFEDMSSGGSPAGVALEAATTATFRFVPLSQSANVKS